MQSFIPTLVQLQNAAASLVAVGVVSGVLFGIFVGVDRLIDRVSSPREVR